MAEKDTVYPPGSKNRFSKRFGGPGGGAQTVEFYLKPHVTGGDAVGQSEKNRNKTGPNRSAREARSLWCSVFRPYK